MSGHTPTPWQLGTLAPPEWRYIIDGNFTVVASVADWDDNCKLVHEFQQERAKPNSARIVACVNAFHSNDGRTIATESIAPGVVFDLRDLLDRVLRAIAPEPGDENYLEGSPDLKPIREARALLATLKIEEPET